MCHSADAPGFSSFYLVPITSVGPLLLTTFLPYQQPAGYGSPDIGLFGPGSYRVGSGLSRGGQTCRSTFRGAQGGVTHGSPATGFGPSYASSVQCPIRPSAPVLTVRLLGVPSSGPSWFQAGSLWVNSWLKVFPSYPVILSHVCISDRKRPVSFRG
jgi:hypothetical protein